MPEKTPFDVVVAGLGPAGLSAALTLHDIGLKVAVVGQPPERVTDMRATALMPASITLLGHLQVWQSCATQAQPMTGLRIVDDTGRLLRSPEMLFRASELDQEQFGACIAITHLVQALENAVRERADIAVTETRGIRSIRIGHKLVEVDLEEGATIRAPLLVGADGRRSPSRQAAGIAATTRNYPQTALAVTFHHERPHEGISVEFHRPSGPLTTVPLPGRMCSLVWVEDPDEAARLMALDDNAFAEALRAALHGLLGRISSVSVRTAFPLSILTAERLAQRRTVLIGEAAHVIPPIGAQGLNLGLRDVACLADVIETARQERHVWSEGAPSVDFDPGANRILEAYVRSRSSDVHSRTAAVDILNRMLLSSFLPVQALRGFGMHMLALVPPLRHALMREGLAPSRSLPRMMRPSPEAYAASPDGRETPVRRLQP